MTTPPQQETISPCPQCGGRRVGTYLSDVLSLKKGRTVGTLQALVCISCGLTMLYVRDLTKVREYLQKEPEGFFY
jgi:hypothetical protein